MGLTYIHSSYLHVSSATKWVPYGPSPHPHRCTTLLVNYCPLSWLCLLLFSHVSLRYTYVHLLLLHYCIDIGLQALGNQRWGQSIGSNAERMFSGLPASLFSFSSSLGLRNRSFFSSSNQKTPYIPRIFTRSQHDGRAVHYRFHTKCLFRTSVPQSRSTISGLGPTPFLLLCFPPFTSFLLCISL